MPNLSLCLSGWNNFPSDLQMCKEVQNLLTLMFSVFLLKTQTGLWKLCPETDLKIDSQYAVSWVLDFAEK